MSKLKDEFRILYYKLIAKPFIRKEYIKTVRQKYNLNQPAPTIISSNCIGGEIYNDLGLKFTSPIINLWLHEQEFLKIVLNPKHYFSQKLVFIKEDGIDYPVALADDVRIYFSHYKTETEAAHKWYERCKRIDYDNIYIIMSDLRISEEEFLKFQQITQCKRKIMFTSNTEHGKYPDVFRVKMYKEDAYVRSYANNKLNGYRDFEEFFDFAAWLNGEIIEIN